MTRSGTENRSAVGQVRSSGSPPPKKIAPAAVVVAKVRRKSARWKSGCSTNQNRRLFGGGASMRNRGSSFTGESGSSANRGRVVAPEEEAGERAGRSGGRAGDHREVLVVHRRPEPVGVEKRGEAVEHADRKDRAVGRALSERGAQGLGPLRRLERSKMRHARVPHGREDVVAVERNLDRGDGLAGKAPPPALPAGGHGFAAAEQ